MVNQDIQVRNFPFQIKKYILIPFADYLNPGFTKLNSIYIF